MKYFRGILRQEKKLITGYLVLGISLAFLETASAGYYQILIDRFSSRALTLGAILGYGMILLLLCGGSYLDEYPSVKLKQEIYHYFKIAALKKISRIDYLAYQTLGTGKLVQRIEHGADAGKGMRFEFGKS